MTSRFPPESTHAPLRFACTVKRNDATNTTVLRIQAINGPPVSISTDFDVHGLCAAVRPDNARHFFRRFVSDTTVAIERLAIESRGEAGSDPRHAVGKLLALDNMLDLLCTVLQEEIARTPDHAGLVAMHLLVLGTK